MYRKIADPSPAAAHQTERRSLLRTLGGLGGLALGGGLLAACTPILPGSDRGTPRLFTLSPQPPSQGPSLDAPLVVLRPFADAGLDTTRIALRRNSLEIEYYAQVNWQTRAPDLLRSTLVNGLADSGRFANVTREPLSGDPLVLETELRRFDADYTEGGPPRARLRVTARLHRRAERSVVASRGFDIAETAARDEMSSIITAFDAAATRLLAEMADWVVEQAPGAA